MTSNQEMGDVRIKPCLSDIEFPFHGFVSSGPKHVQLGW